MMDNTQRASRSAPEQSVVMTITTGAQSLDHAAATKATGQILNTCTTM